MTRMQAEKAAADANATASRGTSFVAQRHSFGVWYVREYNTESNQKRSSDGRWDKEAKP